MRGPSASEVDAAVRSVLAELRVRSAPREGAAGRTIGGSFFAGRVLGLKVAEGLGAGTTEVRVGPGTVITPLGREALKRRGIVVRIVSESELVQVGCLSEWGFAIEAGIAGPDGWRRAIVASEAGWRDVGDTAEDAAHWTALAPGRGSVVLTPEASVATWRAIQFSRVRAATVTSPDAVVRACQALGANLLAIEPAGLSIAAVKHMLATFRRAGRLGPNEESNHADRRSDRAGHALATAPVVETLEPRHRVADASGGIDRGLVASW